MDARVRHQVGLELGDVDVQRAVEAERRGERRDDLRERRFRLVYVGRSMSRERRQMSYTASLSSITATSVCSSSECVDSTELYGSTTAVDDLRGRVDGEPELGLAAVVDGEALEEQRAEAGAGAAADGVEDEEALQARAVVGELADAVERRGRRSPCRWCSDRARSCWRRPPCRR